MTLIILSLLWYIGVFGGNIRTVAPDRVYRSAQLTGEHLSNLLKSRHILTVINLRGAETTDNWYRNETSVCRSLGVAHVDIAFSATHLPPPEQLNKLMKAFADSRYPVLIHCMGGADRTGLAASLYEALYDHQGLDQAESSQLSLRYGHIRWSNSKAMDHFFDLYRQTAGGQDLRTWILKTYPRLYPQQPDR